MLFGRCIGYLLVGLALVMASADAVMAVGLSDHATIATADVVTLLLGDPMGGAPAHSTAQRLGLALMHTPAWSIFMLVGVAAAAACRKRQRRFRFKRA